jgi:hypothetical protein
MVVKSDAPGIKVSEESKAGDKEFLAKEGELQVNSGAPVETEQDAQNDLSGSPIKSDTSGEVKEVKENFQENFDQGAIIDWVIKNRTE